MSSAAIGQVLRIAAHDNNLFRRETFDAIARTLAQHLPLDCLAVVVPEAGGKRLYATSAAGGARALPPFGARFPHGPQEETVLDHGRIKICDDTRNSQALDQIAVHWGFLSYVILPIRRRPWTLETGQVEFPAGMTIVAKLVVAFREAGCASSAPLDLLHLIADLFGETFDRSTGLARQRRLAMILETSGDAMLAWDHDGLVTDANNAAAGLTGVPREALMGTPIREFLDPERELSRIPSGRAVRTTLRRRDAGGSRDVEPITVSVTITLVEDDPHVAMHALIRDETHLVAAEREAASHFARVRELEKDLRALLDNAPLIIFRLDSTAGDLRYLSRHAERLLGVPTAEALATPGFLREVHRDPEARRAFDAALANAKAGKVSPSYEARLYWRSGNEITVRGTVYPLLTESGQVIAIEGVLVDVSAEHSARQRAVQADRLSTLGMLAAGVAHEINNPAAFILLGLNTLERRLSEPVPGVEGSSGDGLRSTITELRDSMNRIVGIVRDLRVFASPPREQTYGAVTDVEEAVASAISLTRSRISERAKLVEALADVPPVLIDSGRLVQVLVNLLINAVQALPRNSPDRPVIWLATRNCVDGVEIEVCDNGVGIPKENLARIWAPFFTTKSDDLGSGLGLSISREIVERAGGSIRVESPAIEIDGQARGSRFVVSLPAGDPVAHDRVAREEAENGEVDPTGPRLRVLLVEDEIALSRALALEVGRVHDVVAVASGDRALEILSEAHFDVVLCDLRMPGMSGEDLYERVRASNPEQARDFIFMSGMGFVPEVERFLAATGRPVLHKPFLPARALQLISKESSRYTAVQKQRP